MPISIGDRIFWLRTAFGVAAGTGTEFLFYNDYLTGITFALLLYLATYYIVRRTWGTRLKPEEQNKLLTAGLPNYVLLFLFVWLFLFTLGAHFLTL